jgi:hypothetical protein
VTPREKYLLLFILAGSMTGAGVYLVNDAGTPLAPNTVAGAARVCGLPSLGQATVYNALNVPLPTLPDGGGSGDCLAPADAEDGLRKGRIAAGVLPAWRAAGLAAGQCVAGLLAVEFGEGAGVDGGLPAAHEELVQVCGPAPGAAATARLEKLARLPGTSVRILDTIGPYALASQPPIKRWTQGHYPAAAQNRFLCACRPRSDVAGACRTTIGVDAGNAPAPFASTLPPGTWSGTCTRKPCVEAAEVAGVSGLGYSMPAECR